MDLRLVNYSIFFLLFGTQACLTLRNHREENVGFENPYPSLPDQDPFQPYGYLPNEESPEPYVRYSPQDLDPNRNKNPVLVENSGNSINYLNSVDRIPVSKARTPDEKNDQPIEYVSTPATKSKSHKHPPKHKSIERHSDDLIGSAIRGQKEEVQGEKRYDSSQLSHKESYGSPYSHLFDYETGGRSTFGDIYFVVIVAGCSVVAMGGVIGTGYCLYRLQQHNKAAADVDYPAYGVVGPITKDAGTGNSPTSSGHASPTESKRSVSCSPAATAVTGGVFAGDRKLAQNAQRYHYEHQKHQIQAAANRVPKEPRLTSTSDQDSEEDNDEVDYIVYECPGLAPTGEMEVKNPLFQDDSTPASPMKTPASPNGKASVHSDTGPSATSTE